MSLTELLHPGHAWLDAHDGTAGVDLLAVSQYATETHCPCADCDLLPADHLTGDTNRPSVGGHLLHPGHEGLDAHLRTADCDLLPADHPCRDGQTTPVGGHLLPTPATSNEAPPTVVSSQGWVELRLSADLFARAQAERIATGNLLRTYDPDFFADHFARLEATEHAAKLMLRRCYKRVAPPELRAWQEASKGVGPDSFARILGHLGDPYIATPHRWEGTGADRVLIQGESYVRTVAQLWQYCGHGDPARRKTKGMTADDLFALGNPTLKMLVHLQAEWCMKQPGGRYRLVYEAARLSAADKTHATPCVRCGPSGKPAVEGSPWSAGHQHAHALRIVGKELLRDMWLVRSATEVAA